MYFGSLAYSGNFKVIAGRDLYGITLSELGYERLRFFPYFRAGRALPDPAGVLRQYGGIGRNVSPNEPLLLGTSVAVPIWAETLPALYNSWEATEFNVNVADQTRLAEIAAGIGVELFVMDDGWFGARNNDRAGLGTGL